MPGPWRQSHPTDRDKPTKPTEPPPTGAPSDNQVTFTAEAPVRTMDELVVAEVVRRRVEAALSRVINHELLYETWNLRSLDPRRAGVALNFYGPPGTGKSLCAEAVAHRLGRAALFVNYAEIESRYVGETPKNIVRAFEAARAQDAVLVFDEADSILGSRLSSVTQSADHGVNVSRAAGSPNTARYNRAPHDRPRRRCP